MGGGGRLGGSLALSTGADFISEFYFNETKTRLLWGAFCKVSSSKCGRAFLSRCSKKNNRWPDGVHSWARIEVSGVGETSPMNPSAGQNNSSYLPPFCILRSSCLHRVHLLQIILSASISSGHRACIQIIASVARKTPLFSLLYIQRRVGTEKCEPLSSISRSICR